MDVSMIGIMNEGMAFGLAFFFRFGVGIPGYIEMSL